MPGCSRRGSLGRIGGRSPPGFVAAERRKCSRTTFVVGRRRWMSEFSSLNSQSLDAVDWITPNITRLPSKLRVTGDFNNNLWMELTTRLSTSSSSSSSSSSFALASPMAMLSPLRRQPARSLARLPADSDGCRPKSR
eukprot:5132233-Prymnesium_polylepis.1